MHINTAAQIVLRRQRCFCLILRQICIAPLFGLSMLTSSLSRAAPPAGPWACSNDVPVKQIKATNFYKDERGSIVDNSDAKQSVALIKPVALFLFHLSNIIDNNAGNSNAMECGFHLLQQWAAADALLKTPDNLEAIRERARFAIGLNVLAIKMQASGNLISDEILHWLHNLSQLVLRDFGARPPVGNLYIWSGVNAASDALLSGDKSSLAYSDLAWQRGLAMVNPDGTVHSELQRGARALLYHQYFLSALLMLRSFRNALDVPIAPDDDRKLKLLASRVEDGLCDPNDMKGLVDGVDQELPPPYQFAVPTAFGGGILDRRWQKCVKLHSPLIDNGAGGDMLKAAKALKSIRRR